MSVYAAAKKFNVPYETLRRWKECPPTHQGAGRGTVLSKEEENTLLVLWHTLQNAEKLIMEKIKFQVYMTIKSKVVRILFSTMFHILYRMS